ncbi:MAG: leucine-rich repeat protein [Clostridia bacterium]|nr:leucine-rich repeat protein [Clostridia bacterium]
MKTKSKRIISIFLTAVMLMSIAAMGISAFAATEYTEGSYRYTVSGSEATITKATNVSGDITLPAALGGYPVTAIADGVFAHNTAITQAVIPDSVKTIGNSAFEGCTALAGIEITASVTNIGSGVFRGCTSLEKIAVEEGNPSYTADETGVLFTKDKTKIVGYPAGNKRTEYVIPDYVTEIERYSFAGSVNLEEVIWNNPAIKLGLGAFSDCRGLRTVTIPEGTTHLSDWLFNACFSLSEINFPESLESIASGTFHWCTGLEYVELPSGLKEIGNNAFRECERLKGIKLPDGLEVIRPNAFHQCFSLESIEIPESVTYIGDTAFYQCYSLKEITFPKGTTAIYGSTLRYCVDLENVSIPDSVTAINDDSFMDCRSLETVTIPENVKAVTGKAFVNCIAFESVSVDADNPYFTADSSGVLFNNNKTKLVYYPANKQQKVYTVPDTVTSIGTYAFGSAQTLASVIIPDSVTAIEAAAFYGNNIRDIYFEGTQEQWNEFAAATDTANPVTATVHFNHKSTDHVHEYAQSITAEPTCSANGTKSYSCSCSESIQTSLHYSTAKMLCSDAEREWKVVEPADCSAAGTRNLCCSKCGYALLVRDTEKPAHSLGITVSDSAIDFECTDCGYSYTEEIPDGAGYVHYKGGEKERVHIYNAGEKIVVPPVPEKEGLSFFGWKDESGNTVELGTMPAGNLVLTAAFGKILESESFDVTATFDEDCFNEDVSLSVKEVEGESKLGSIYMLGKESYKQVGFFNIKMVNEKSETVQPNSGKTVTVKFPIPEGYGEGDRFIITHWFSNGDRERFSTDAGGGAIIENGYIIISVGQFSEFSIHVKTSAKVSKLPSKTAYNYKEGLNLSGIELTVTNSDGTTEKVTDTSKMTVSGYDSSKVGEQTVFVEYDGCRAEFTVTVSYAWWQWIIRILLLGFLWY